jgi:hypothetical protein
MLLLVGSRRWRSKRCRGKVMGKIIELLERDDDDRGEPVRSGGRTTHGRSWRGD